LDSADYHRRERGSCIPGPKTQGFAPPLELSKTDKLDRALTVLQKQFDGFAFNLVGELGGGSLYEIKKGATVQYGSLVATKDGTGTLVMLWDRNPIAATSATP
jgi:hypothetical protein